MPLNKLALLRYKTIDKCLQNRFRKWTLDDLIETVSDTLYEYEGISTGVSKRTIQLDIQNMRSDKLGYNAPIIVEERKYYTYEDKEYSIMRSNLSVQDLDKLSELVTLLKQFKGFSYFKDLNSMIGKLEDKIHSQKNSEVSYIDLEKNELLKGLEFIDPLLQALIAKQTLIIRYQSFRAREPNDVEFIPYLLKEYNNRWFILGKKMNGGHINLLALDRIHNISINETLEYQEPEFEVSNFFNDAIGVTKTLGQKSYSVVLQLDRKSAPYVLTKPIHPSQELLKEDSNGIIISFKVVPNFELEREILGFGESVKVLAPSFLKNRIQKRLRKMNWLYEED